MKGMNRHLTTKDLIKRWKTKESTPSYWRWAGRGPRFISYGLVGFQNSLVLKTQREMIHLLTYGRALLHCYMNITKQN